MNEYDEDYFERGIETGKSCYVNYHWMPEMTLPAVQVIMDYCGITPDDSVLDFGCAKGYYVRAFRELGVSAFGVDVSEYAISQSGLPYVTHISGPDDIPVPLGGRYDWVLAKDVLEHVPLYDITPTLETLAEICRNAFVVVPLGINGEYNAAENGKDITHRICQPLAWWERELSEFWPEVDASYQVPGLKEQWRKTPRAHGFFICKGGGQ